MRAQGNTPGVPTPLGSVTSGPGVLRSGMTGRCRAVEQVVPRGFGDVGPLPEYFFPARL